MIKTSVSLQGLRRRMYARAKDDKSWRSRGVHAHVCKTETLREAYWIARQNNRVPGIDGVSFEAIEEAGVERFVGQIREELVSGTYRPVQNPGREIPKDEGKVRVLGIQTIGERVVQGAAKLIPEPGWKS